MISWLATVEPSFEHATALQLLASLWTPSPVAGLPGLSSYEGLARVGIDREQPLAVVPDRVGRVAVVVFGLSSRKRFERWLSSIDGPDRARVKIGGEVASVIGATSDTPVICLARSAHAYCQIGPAERARPTGPLERLLAFEGNTLGNTPARVEALRALDPGAHFYVTMDPSGLATIVKNRLREHALAKARFLDKKSAAKSLDRVRAETAHLDRYATYIDGAAAALYPNGDDVTMQAQLLLTSAGRRFAARAAPDTPPDETIVRWAETPALFRLLAHMHPELLQIGAKALGIELPERALDGTFAMLTFGVDAECPSARRRREAIGPSRWAFLMPSAAAVGLTSAEMADRVHTALRPHLETPAVERSAGDRPALSGRAWGSVFEINVLDDLLLVGTGRGSSAAALRRLGALPSAAVRAAKRRPFLEVDVDLRAVDAAFAAGAFSPEHRAELLTVEAFRLQMKPLLETVDELSIAATKHDDGRRIAIDARAGR